MKSKIKIDLDGSNNPVLRIELSNDQSDLRDKALARFIEGIGTESNALFIRRSNSFFMEGAEPVYELYPFSQLERTINWKDTASMMMRFEAEYLLAQSLGFSFHQILDGVKVWVDSDTKYWIWDKYGFVPAFLKEGKAYPVLYQGYRTGNFPGMEDVITGNIGESVTASNYKPSIN